MNDFLDRVANILETPSVTEGLEFRSVRGWGSMMGFALFIMLEDEYGVKLTPEECERLIIWMDSNGQYIAHDTDAEAQRDGKIVKPALE